MRRFSHLGSLHDREGTRRARELRRTMTAPELRLWYYLRTSSLRAAHFRRQVPIGRYIVDFLCERRRLIVEVDGGSHSESVLDDATRTRWLEGHGYRVIRFWNHEVMANIEGVVAEIERAIG